MDFALGLADRYYGMQKGEIVATGQGAELDHRMVKDYLAV